MTSYRLLYTVYDNRTDLPIIVDGNARETAEAMGIKYPSVFYKTTFDVRHGKNKRWTILTRQVHEDLED